ncbi:hypothetical protein NBRC10512_004301 [Rhodotorula toruloides]|uniref:RHTO0S04e08812g1_1 n=2 Tax=Rhodotorula toruloides TaxID=5286 RepID=A0A061AWH1_RHOTO|nr:uncharacterized protein RHTO_02133 [Rhodotorula toruloides NP11]EMS21262.1 hypothetical protein RHTO_02133 [Rhodotorula toruloides NP11]CDR39758.1 RHTO0S04e08812g1_1 [Rhodotorula toruloides]
MLTSPRSIPVQLPVGTLETPRPLRAAPPRRQLAHQRTTHTLHLSLPTTRTAHDSCTQAFPGARGPGSVAVQHLDDGEDLTLPRLPPAHDDIDMLTEKHPAWLEHAPFDHFELDSSSSSSQIDEPAPLPLNHPRSNSLELDLGDLPKPNFLFPSQAYPSPVSPCTTLFSSSTASYFELDQRRPRARSRCASAASGEGDDMSLELPPSPALVPIFLVAAPRDTSPSRPAPHVEPSVSHPLHRAKRLSMTPLPTLSSLPSTDAPPKLRKNSIVDLPPAPVSPPLTPESSLGLVGLPSIEVLECGRRLSVDSNAGDVDAFKRQRCA